MGTVYELSPTLKGAWTATILHSFTGGDDGVGPSQPLTMDAEGNIYGTTGSGGNGEYCQGIGCGIVFELSPTKSGPWTGNYHSCLPRVREPNGMRWKRTGRATVPQCSRKYVRRDLRRRSPMTAQFSNSCEWRRRVELWPRLRISGRGLSWARLGGVIGDAEGNLYGLWDGGVYELQGSGDSFTYETLYFFCSNCDGPIGTQGGGLIFDSSDNFYGTSYGGGNGYGTVFELSPAGGGTWNEERCGCLTIRTAQPCVFAASRRQRQSIWIDALRRCQRLRCWRDLSNHASVTGENAGDAGGLRARPHLWLSNGS